VVVLATSTLGLSAWLGAASGAPAWAFYTGFVENRLGELTFSDPDLARLALFVGVGTVATQLGTHRYTPTLQLRRFVMADLVFLAVTGLFFLVSALILKAVERL
jgi:hypothetical protein